MLLAVQDWGRPFASRSMTAAGSFIFARRIIAAITNGLNPASRYVWMRYFSKTPLLTSPFGSHLCECMASVARSLGQAESLPPNLRAAYALLLARHLSIQVPQCCSFFASLYGQELQLLTVVGLLVPP